jgi:hypothetical protein
VARLPLRAERKVGFASSGPPAGGKDKGGEYREHQRQSSFGRGAVSLAQRRTWPARRWALDGQARDMGVRSSCRPAHSSSSPLGFSSRANFSMSLLRAATSRDRELAFLIFLSLMPAAR